MKLYLSGKMSGLEHFNFPEFHRVTGLLREAGHEVYNPAEADSDPETGLPDPEKCALPREVFLRRDVMVIASRKLGVVLMPSWKESIGAKLEAAVAQYLGLPVYAFVEESPWRLEELREPTRIEVA